MDLAFLNNLRKITDEDERIVTITLLIDIVSNLINDRNKYRHHTLPINYIQETFHKYQGAMQCLDVIGFKQVIFFNELLSITKRPIFYYTNFTKMKLYRSQKFYRVLIIDLGFFSNFFSCIHFTCSYLKNLSVILKLGE